MYSLIPCHFEKYQDWIINNYYRFTTKTLDVLLERLLDGKKRDCAPLHAAHYPLNEGCMYTEMLNSADELLTSCFRRSFLLWPSWSSCSLENLKRTPHTITMLSSSILHSFSPSRLRSARSFIRQQTIEGD